MGEDDNKKKRSIKYVMPSDGDSLDYLDSTEPDEGIIKYASKLREQSYLFWGIIFGLILGIVGNLFVSHFYGIFSAGIIFHLGEEGLFFYNLVFAVGLFVIMVIITWSMYARIKRLEDISSRLESYFWRKKRFLNLQKEAQDKRKKGEEKNED